MNREDYTKCNRQMLNETAAIHAQVECARLFEQVSSANFSTFDDVEKHVFSHISLVGKAVGQLGCNNRFSICSRFQKDSKFTNRISELKHF